MISQRASRPAAALLALTLCLAPDALAAQGTGEIAGQLRDAVGSGISGATIALPALSRTAVSDSVGRFHFDGLVPGAHGLLITAEGYASVTENALVRAGSVTSVSIQLTFALTGISAETSVLPGSVIPARDVSNGLVLAATSNVIVRLAGLQANLAEKTARQIFARVPGAFVYDMDGSGNQINVSTRGLDPHRSWELNVRQDGVLLNSDLYGYPASHYSPPLEAIERLELIRGTAALQYGSQYGGLVNYVTKESATDEALGGESINSVGSFGLLSTYNAVGGRVGAVRYYGYMSERRSDGFRRGAESDYEAQYLSATLQASRTVSLRGQVGRTKYVYRIPGALTDSMFLRDPRASTRARDYYSPDIKVPALSLDWRREDGTHLNARVSAVLGPRNSVTFVGFANQTDLPDSTGAYAARQVDVDRFRSFTLETRLTRPWRLGGLDQTLAIGASASKNRMHRQQQGVGTSGSDFDLSVTGAGFRRDIAFRTESGALYLENLFRLTSAWTVVPGVRVEFGTTRMDGQLAYYDPADTPREIDHRYSLVGIRTAYAFPGGAEVYGGWSQAYRPQILRDVLPANALERTDPDLDDSHGWTLEAGLRGTLSGRFSYDVGVFDMRIGDRFGTLLRADSVGTSYLFRTNVGHSRTRGVEASLEAWLVQRRGLAIWTYTATSYFDGKYIRGTVVSGGQNVDIKGNEIESVPDWISRSGLSFESGSVSGNLLVSHTSSSYADALNTVPPSPNAAVGIVPAYTILDVNAAYQVTGWLRARAGVNNVFDRRYFTKRPQFYPGPGVWPSDGRGFQVSVELRRWPD